MKTNQGLSIEISELERITFTNGMRRLTITEKAILEHMINGRSAKEIASRRGISPRTVEAHKVNLMNKLGIHHTREMFRILMALWTEPSSGKRTPLRMELSQTEFSD